MLQVETGCKKVEGLVKEHICCEPWTWTIVQGLTVGVGGGLGRRGQRGKI